MPTSTTRTSQLKFKVTCSPMFTYCTYKHTSTQQMNMENIFKITEKKKLCVKRKNTEFWVKNIAYNDNKQRLFVSAVCFVSETQSFVPESADNRIYCSRCAARRYSIIELIVVTEAFQRENNAWTCLVCVFDCNNDRRCSGTCVLLVHLRQ